MKIEIKEKRRITFGTLMEGQTFMDSGYDDCAVLMVVKPSIEINLTTDKAVGEQYTGYAVDLTNGLIVGYRSDEEVTPVDAALTAER